MYACKQMISGMLMVLAGAGLALVMTEPAQATDKPATEQNPAGSSKDIFHVYYRETKCGNIHTLLGAYKSADEALWAAADFREKKESDGKDFVVVTGTNGQAPQNEPSTVTVHRHICRGIFKLEATPANIDQARKIAKDLRKKEGDRVEIILHFEKKGTVS